VPVAPPVPPMPVVPPLPVAPPVADVVAVDVPVDVEGLAELDWGDSHAEGASAIRANSTATLAPPHGSR
jgi:hypothetical protein